MKPITIEEIQDFMENNKITKIELILGSFIITQQRKRKNDPYIQIHDPND